MQQKKSIIAASLAMLGTMQRDRATGFTGMVSSIAFDAQGCVQAYIVPPVSKEHKLQDGGWFDLKRLEPKGGRRMVAPDFGIEGEEPGGIAKPALPSGPR